MVRQLWIRHARVTGAATDRDVVIDHGRQARASRGQKCSTQDLTLLPRDVDVEQVGRGVGT